MNTITTNTKLEVAAIRKIVADHIGSLPAAIKQETVIDIFRGVTIGAVDGVLMAKTKRGKEIADAVRPILCALPTIEAVFEVVENIYNLIDRFQKGDRVMPTLDHIHPELVEKFIADVAADAEYASR